MKDRIFNETTNEFGGVEFQFKMEVLSEFGRRFDEITERHAELLIGNPDDVMADVSQAAENLKQLNDGMDLKTVMQEGIARTLAEIADPEEFVRKRMENAREKLPDATPEEMKEWEQAFRAELNEMKSMVNNDQLLQKNLKAADQMQQMFEESMKELEDLDLDDDDGEDEDDLENDEEAVEGPTPGIYHVSMAEGAKWSPEHEALIARIEGNWPTFRTKILQAVFDPYQEGYEEVWDFMGGGKHDKMILPDPTSPEVVQDLFQIHSIHLGKDASKIGFEGSCTWDEEHGVGILIDGDSCEAGSADLAFDNFD